MNLWDWGFVIEIIPNLLTGLVNTVYVTVIGSIFGISLGFFLAVIQAQRFWLGKAFVRTYIYIVRGTPFLIQLYLIFYALPSMGLLFSPIVAGCVALALNFSSYFSEIFRGGFESVPQGQREASRALNFGPIRTWVSVIFPQAMRPIVPALGNYVNLMFKVSALLAAISVNELFGTALTIGGNFYRYLEPMTITGVLFLVISIPVSFLVKSLEKKAKAYAV